MGYKTWSAADIQYLRDNFEQKTQGEIACFLGKTRLAVKCKCRLLKLKLSNAERGKRAAAGRKQLTQDIDNQFDTVVAENYLTMPLKSICRKTGFSMAKVYNSLRRQGLKVPDELTEQRRGTGMFRQGFAPPNKGKKQAEYMTPEAIERTVNSRFGRGHRPHNAKPVGIESIIDGYTKIKIGAPNKWKYKHVMVWEAENGTLPKGKIIVFLDKNTQNFDIGNLEAITRAEHAVRNHDIEKGAIAARELHDTYVAGVLKRKTGLANADIPQELIAIKRAELTLIRELKSIKKNDNSNATGGN